MQKKSRGNKREERNLHSEAAKSGERAKIVHETADLWFHTLIMLAQTGLKPDDILTELERRFGVSGLDEKAGRQEPPAKKSR